MGWRSFVAIGDSFTEGLDDPHPQGGGYRGWADLVAAQLAAMSGPPAAPLEVAVLDPDGEPADTSTFGYANLAIRGRLLDAVLTDQLPAALRMRPDLVSFAAGGNDILRRRCDPNALATRYEDAVREIRSVGADVVLFRFADLKSRLPGGQRLIAPRVAALNDAVAEIAERYGATLVDLWADEEFANPVLWSVDRLHLAPAGHRRVAAHVLAALGLAVDPEWMIAPRRPDPLPWLSARGADLVWIGRHLAPWVSRRLTGRSSGDKVLPKRPTLAPLEPLEPLTAREQLTGVRD